MTDAVIFDLDETLLDRTTSLVAFLSDQHTRYGLSLGCATFATWRDRFIALDARGHVHKSIVYPAILAEFDGNPALGVELLQDYRETCSRFAQPFAGMAETLRTLRERGVRLGIVTNGETDFQSRHIEALGLGAMVDVVLISEKEGLRKPDQAIFERAASRLQAVCSDCLFVGDNPAVDILGAHAAGMRTAWFRNGLNWPVTLPPVPGAMIDRLSDVLSLIGGGTNLR